jgi:hypothetical protein
MTELINNKILIIKDILTEKCGLYPDLYDELSELLDDIRILSDAKSSALENAYKINLDMENENKVKMKFTKVLYKIKIKIKNIWKTI